MININLTPKHCLNGNVPPYIIAEIGANHNGDMCIAKKLIDEAKSAGADCVKFQSWSKSSVFSKIKYKENCFLNDDYRQRTDTSLEEIVDSYSISTDQLHEMSQYCREVDIDFTSTPFSESELDALVDLKVPFIKVASMDLNNYPFLEYVANAGKPIILSTGLSELHEIDKAIKTIENAGNNKIIILHCIAIYPTPEIDVNLNNIETLQKIYPYPIGFSDHSLGFSIPLASVVKGACIIEKHFTLDQKMEGWDHKISATPNELRTICSESKRVFSSLGSYRIATPEDETRKNEFRRSLVAARACAEGDTLSINDLVSKRPGTGIPPEELKFLIGRTLRNNLDEDQLVSWDDVI